MPIDKTVTFVLMLQMGEGFQFAPTLVFLHWQAACDLNRNFSQHGDSEIMRFCFTQICVAPSPPLTQIRPPPRCMYVCNV